MPARVVAVFGVAFALLLAGFGSARPAVFAPRLASDSPFVYASGGTLWLGGAPWLFTGYDAYQLTSTEYGFQCGGYYSDQQLNQLFAEMAQNSGSIAVRTWFFQSYGGPGRWGQFDRVLNAAAAHGIHVIPVLTNEWRQCEGFPHSVDRYRSLSWWQGGYRVPDMPGELSFRDFAVAMARHYADNPTIAFWMLVNESEAKFSHHGGCDNNAAAAAMRGVADDVTAAMKAVDPNHLVSLGTMGGGQCGTQGSGYQYVNGGRVDICELHDYSAQAVMGDQYRGTVPDIAVCRAMGKPLIAGEVGIDASVQPDWRDGCCVTPATLANRAYFFDLKMRGLFDRGASGFLIWSKSLSPSVGYSVGPEDPTERVMLARQDYFDAVRAAYLATANQIHSAAGAGPALPGTAAVTTRFALSVVGIGAALDGQILLTGFGGAGQPGWLEFRFR